MTAEPPTMPERLPRGKPALSIDQMEQIAKLSEKYLQCEATEFSEDELLSNLRALYEISLQQNSKMSKKHSKRIEKLAITAFSAFGPNRHPSHISDTAGSDSPQKHHSSSLKDNTGTETILKDKRSPGLFGRALYLQKAGYYRRLADKYHDKSATTKDENKCAFYGQKVVENSVKAAEFYVFAGSFKEAGNMYIDEAARFARSPAQKDVFYSKGAECISKAAEDKEKSGSFREAGDMYHDTGFKLELSGSKQEQQRAYFYLKAGECYPKAAEIHEKSGEFGEAGDMYRNAANNISDPVQKQAFFSKAAECYEKNENFRHAGEMHYEKAKCLIDLAQKQAVYLKAAECYSKDGDSYMQSKVFEEAGDMYKTAVTRGDPAQKNAYASKSRICFDFANALNANWKDGEFLVSLASRFFNEPYMFSSDMDKSVFAKSVEKYAAQNNSKISDAGGFFAKVISENVWKSLETPGGQATVDNFSIKNEKGELKVYFNLAINDVLASLPMRYLPIFIEESLGKKDAIYKLKESQLPEAFNRMVQRIKTESKEFELQLSSGEKISAKYAKYLYCTISNIESSKFLQSINAVAEKLGLEKRTLTPTFFEELHSAANEKLRLSFNMPAKIYSLEFIAKQVDASVPADAIRSAATAINDSIEAYERQKGLEADPKKELRERCGEVLTLSGIQDEAQRKQKILGLLPENKKEAYLAGKMTDENALRLILKNKDIGDLSWVFWDTVSTVPKEEATLLERVSKSEQPNQAETNRLVQIVGKFDVYLQEYLSSNNLSALEPVVRSTQAFKEITNIKKKVTEVASKQASETMGVQIVFGQENRLLDTFAGSFSGNCLGDSPAFSLARKDVAIATIYKDSRPVGAAFLLLREINGKNSLVLFGIDFSEALTGSKDAETILSTEKVNELAKWVAQCVHDYATTSGLGLYATEQGGGISNDGTVASELLRHFGKIKVSFEESGKLHANHSYNMSNAFSFEFKT